MVVVGDGALMSDPDLLGCDCQDQLGVFSRAEVRSGNKDFENHGHLLLLDSVGTLVR